jgi:hypothetical protein
MRSRCQCGPLELANGARKTTAARHYPRGGVPLSPSIAHEGRLRIRTAGPEEPRDFPHRRPHAPREVVPHAEREAYDAAMIREPRRRDRPWPRGSGKNCNPFLGRDAARNAAVTRCHRLDWLSPAGERKRVRRKSRLQKTDSSQPVAAWASATVRGHISGVFSFVKANFPAWRSCNQGKAT